MNSKENLPEIHAVVTESGLIQLGNLIEEYSWNTKMSESKLSELYILLLTYYLETENIIYEKIFDEIKNFFNKNNAEKKSLVKNSIKTLHENGHIEMRSKHKPSFGGIT